MRTEATPRSTPAAAGALEPLVVCGLHAVDLDRETTRVAADRCAIAPPRSERSGTEADGDTPDRRLRARISSYYRSIAAMSKKN